MAKKKKTQSASPKRKDNEIATPYERVPTKDLCFDPANPRLVEYVGDGKPTQDNLLRVLWQKMAVDELAMSIAACGYFDYEPLFVAEENGKLLVIEGNRRLAAVRLLLDKQAREALRATDLPKITTSRAQSLQSLPVIRTSRNQVWQLLGVKHVNGPAKWGSYAKAHYIAQVHGEFGVPLDEIASQIGDKHQTVQRLYRALMVIEQAEEKGVFKRENCYKAHFSFSHLYTGLDYEGIAAFVQLREESSESRAPVPASRLGALGELCTWMYGDKALDVRPQVESQNPHLRQLNEVVTSKKAIASLRAGLPLSIALEVSYGDERVFQSALIKARDQLQKARGTLSTGFNGEPDLLRLANDVSELAYDLVEEMERKTSPRRRRKPKKD